MHTVHTCVYIKDPLYFDGSRMRQIFFGQSKTAIKTILFAYLSIFSQHFSQHI